MIVEPAGWLAMRARRIGGAGDGSEELVALRIGSMVFIGLMAAIIVVLNIYYDVIAIPRSDEICRTIMPIHSIGDVVDVVRWNYANWTGRWLGMGIYAAYLPFIDVTGFAYAAGLIILQALWIWAAFVTVRATFNAGVKESWTIALLAILVFWTGMKLPLDNWFWYTGSFEYIVPMALGIVSLIAMLRRPGAAAWCLAALSGIMIGGINELIAMVYIIAIAVLIGLIAVFEIIDRRHIRAISLVLVFAVIGLLLNTIAPGNAVRMQAPEYNGHGDFAVFIRSFLQLQRTPFMWLLDMRLWSLGVVALLSKRFHGFRPDWALRFKGRNLDLALLASAFLIAATGYFAVYFATGSQPPRRVINTLYFVFLLGSMIGLLLLTMRVDLTRIEDATRIKLRTVALAVFAATLLLSPVTEAAIGELSYSHSVWRPAFNHRFDKNTTIVIDREARDLSLYFPDKVTPCYAGLTGSRYIFR